MRSHSTDVDRGTRQKTAHRRTYGMSLLAVACVSAMALAASCSLDPKLPRQVALVYGIASYDSTGLLDLGDTDNDAWAVGDLLESRGYEVVVTRVSADPAEDPRPSTPLIPSRDRLVEDLEWAAAELTEDDFFLLYFSGHGGRASDFAPEPIADDSEPYGHQKLAEYIVLYNDLGSGLYGPGGVVTLDGFTQISMQDDDLAALLRKIPARSKVVILDSCNSGGFIGSAPAIDPIDQDYSGVDGARGFEDRRDALELYASFPGAADADLTFRDAVVLASGGAAEEVWETKYGHGVFTYLLLRGAEGGRADFDRNGYITTSEILGYVAGSMDEMHNDLAHPGLDGGGRLITDARWKYMPRITGGAVDYVLFPAE